MSSLAFAPAARMEGCPFLLVALTGVGLLSVCLSVCSTLLEPELAVFFATLCRCRQFGGISLADLCRFSSYTSPNPGSHPTYPSFDQTLGYLQPRFLTRTLKSVNPLYRFHVCY